MADEMTCTAEAIQKYLIDNGGKVSNQDLVKHFKKFVSGPNSLPNARSVFKDFVNTVATIKVEDGIKFVVLKKRGLDEKSETDSSTSESKDEENKNDSKKCRFSDNKNKEILHSHSSPSIFDLAPLPPVDSPSTQMTSPILWSSDLPPGHVPQPPPRRRYSMKGKENRGAKYEESIRQIHGEKENATSPRDEEIREVVSPGSVKEKAHLLNKMANETDVPLKQNFNPGRRREHRDEKAGDDDACSISTLDPRRKEWIIKSSHSDYHELVRLLREEPKLAFVKDHNKYTALHWAAKRGSLDVIKLMAGTHNLDSNARTSGGSTPLHLAAIFGREEIMEILINTYGADPSIRDYNGKRPLHYLPKNQAERFLMIFPQLAFPIQLCGKIVSGGVGSSKIEKEPGLMRMGSLNSKVKKPSVLSASGRAITRMKSWGSADNIPDRAINLMPPPKTFPKKKKKKYADIIGISENWRGRSPDSDSDSATGLAS